MASWIFETTASADRFVGRMGEQFAARGFTIGPGTWHHIVARHRALRLFVRVDGHEDGVLVRGRAAPLDLESPERGEGIVYEVARDVQYDLARGARS